MIETQKEGRTKKFLYNTVSTAILQTVTMIMGFVLPRTMLKYYGSEVNGLVTSIDQLIKYFSLVEAGLGAATIYSLYKPLANNKHKQISAIVVAARNFYYFSGYVFVLLTAVLSIIYPQIIRTQAISKISIVLLVLVLGVNGAMEFFTLGKYRALLTADQRTYIISIASMIYVIFNCIIIVFFARFKINIAFLRFLSLFAIFIRTFILWLYCKKNYPYINYKEDPDKNALDKRWDALYFQILGVVQQGSPTIIATFMLSLIDVSVYSIYYMVVAGANSILSIFSSGLAASFGDVIARKQTKVLQHSFNEFQSIYYALIALIYGTAAVMIMPFITLYTAGITDANYLYPQLGILFVINGLLYNLKTPQGMLVISAGFYKETKIQTTIQGIIIVVLGIILTPKYKLSGIMVASIISNIYRDLDLMCYIPTHITHLKIRNTFWRMLRCIAMFCIIYFPFKTNIITIHVETYIQWIYNAIFVVLYGIVVVIVFILIFERDDLKSIIKRFLNFL